MAEQQNFPLEKKVSIDKDQLQAILDRLAEQKYTIFGPTIRENAVTYNQMSSVDQLPVGWTDEQDGGRYRLKKSAQPSLFEYVVGPHSWKKVLYPALVKLWSAKKTERGFEIDAPSNTGAPKIALLGVRPCELKALAIHDQILAGGDYVDPYYQSIRRDAFIIAVNCVRPGGTCFCASIGTGPQASEGFDLALTEIFLDSGQRLLVEVGSARGQHVLEALGLQPATEAELATARQALERAADSMGRRLDTDQLKERLYAGFDDPYWDEIAERCLTCGNCTMVCPTCFCMNIQDSTNLTGTTAERERCWDSCFASNFSYIHGGSIRISGYARYRQWLMHKLAYWQDQFGVLGCVGCGRCITWCPVGIDITKEASVLTKQEH